MGHTTSESCFDKRIIPWIVKLQFETNAKRFTINGCSITLKEINWWLCGSKQKSNEIRGIVFGDIKCDERDLDKLIGILEDCLLSSLTNIINTKFCEYGCMDFNNFISSVLII